MIHLDFSNFTEKVDFNKICKDFENAFAHRKKSPTSRVLGKFVEFLLPKDIDPIIDLADSVDFHDFGEIFDSLEADYKESKKVNISTDEIGKTLLNQLLGYFNQLDKCYIKSNNLKNFNKFSLQKKAEMAETILEFRSKNIKPLKIRINRVFRENNLPAPIKDKLGKIDNEYVSDDKLKELIIKELENIANTNNITDNNYPFELYKIVDISKKLSEEELVKQKNKGNLSKSKNILRKIIKSFSFIAAVGEAASFVSLFVFLLAPYLGGPVFIIAIPLGIIMGVSAKYFFDTQVYEVAVDFLKRFYKKGFDFSFSYKTLYNIFIILLGVTSAAILGYIAFLSGGALWGGLIGIGLGSQIISGVIAGIGFLSSCFFITSSLETILSLEKLKSIKNYIDKTFIQPWSILFSQYGTKSTADFTVEFFKTTFKFLYKSCIAIGILGIACFGAIISFEGIEKSLRVSALLGKLHTGFIYALSSIPVISMFFSSISKAKLVSEYIEIVPNSLINLNAENIAVETKASESSDCKGNGISSKYREEYFTWVQRATNLMTFSFFVNAFSEIASKHLSFVSDKQSKADTDSNDLENLIENIKKTSVMEAFTTTEAIMGLAGSVREAFKVKNSNIIESKSQMTVAELRMAASEENLSSSRRLSF